MEVENYSNSILIQIVFPQIFDAGVAAGSRLADGPQGDPAQPLEPVLEASPNDGQILDPH